MPLVSVIIPTYNSAKFLSRAIGSVLGQTYRNLELIIVDDASTDGTLAIIRGYAEKDPRITYIVLEKNSGGPVAPINRGLGVARGEFIAFLDHDDEWLPEKLQEQVAVLQSSPDTVGAAVCDIELVSNDRTKRSFRRLPDFPTDEAALRVMLCADFFFNFSILCMRRDVFRAVGFLDDRFVLGADHDYYIRIVCACSIAVVHKPLLRYTEYEQSLSRSTHSIYNAIADLEFLLEKHNDLFVSHPLCLRHRLVQLSSALISVGKTGEARTVLRKALAINLFALDTLGYYLLTYGGKQAHYALKKIRNIIR